MHLQVRVQGVAFAAQGAHVGLLPGVYALVGLKTRRAAELLPAVHALVGPLSRVHSLVNVQVRAADEALPARLALVRLLPRVDSVVRAEVRVATETLAAGVAFEGLLPGVEPLMVLEVRGLAEGAPARLARVRPLPGVHFEVNAERGPAAEELPAALALQRLRRGLDLLVGGRGWTVAAEPLVSSSRASSLMGSTTLGAVTGAAPTLHTRAGPVSRVPRRVRGGAGESRHSLLMAGSFLLGGGRASLSKGCRLSALSPDTSGAVSTLPFVSTAGMT